MELHICLSWTYNEQLEFRGLSQKKLGERKNQTAELGTEHTE